jgi:NAD(P)-dependent dehydrogenase (short-subunit alcohol dehydrogenase family)
MGTLTGKVSFVTGAASGIGLATAERFAAEGAQVVVADLDEAGGKRAAERLGGRFEHLDVGDAGAWQACVERVCAEEGGLDLLHLNAGAATYAPGSSADPSAAFDITAMPDDAYRRIMSTNVDGVVFGVRAAIPALRARGGGAIVVTASVAGLIPYAPEPVYSMTKHALVGFVRALAPLLSEHRITLNAICPGVVETKMLGAPAARRAREAGLPVAQPSVIADAVLGVATSGQTGQLLVTIDGRSPTHYEFSAVKGLGPAEPK